MCEGVCGASVCEAVCGVSMCEASVGRVCVVYSIYLCKEHRYKIFKINEQMKL